MKKNELLKNTGIIAIGRISTQIVSFLLLPLYTARLSASEYGNFDYIITVASFLMPVMTLLTEEAMFRFLIDCKTTEEKNVVISHVFIFVLINSGIISTVGWIFVSAVQYELGFCIFVYAIASTVVALSNALSRGLGNIVLYSVANFGCSAVNILLNLLLILTFDMGFLAMVLSAVVSNVVVSSCVFIKLRIWQYIKIRKFDVSLIKQLLRYSIPLVPNTISWTVINLSDRLVIMHFLGAAYNGLYSVANKFPNLINIFYSFFNTAWRETSVRIIQAGDIEGLNEIYRIIKNILFSITVLLIGMLHFIYPLFLDSSYAESIQYVPLLAISIYYLSLAGFYGGIFTAFKNTNTLGHTSVIAAGINLGVNLFLVKFLGVYASAISTLVSAYFLYAYRSRKVKKYFKSKPYEELAYSLGLAIIVGAFYITSDIMRIISAVAAALLAIWLNKSHIIIIIKVIGIRKQ